MQLLFVCIGNRNRSPFSQFFFETLINQRDNDLMDRIEIVSAGFVPQVFRDYLARLNIDFPEPFFGRPIAEMTRVLLQQKGITVPLHWRTKELNPKMVVGADLIITALPVQKKELLTLFPEAVSKIFFLREIASWDKHLVLEDMAGSLKYSKNYWQYVEEDPEYVTKILAETENLLVLGYPRIMERLRYSQSPR